MAVRRESVSVKRFLEVFAPAAKQGKSALEIGNMLGIQGTDKQVSTYINVKSAQIRASFRSKAESAGRVQGLAGEDLDKFVAAIVERVPKLARHGTGRKPTDLSELVNFVDGLLASIDPPATVATEDTPVAKKSRKKA